MSYPTRLPPSEAEQAKIQRDQLLPVINSRDRLSRPVLLDRGVRPTPPQSGGLACLAYAWWEASNVASLGVGAISSGWNAEWNGAGVQGDGDFTTYFGFNPSFPVEFLIMQPGWYTVNFLIEIQGLTANDLVAFGSSPTGDLQELHGVSFCVPGETFARLTASSTPFFLYAGGQIPYEITMGVSGASSTGYVQSARAYAVALSGNQFPG